MIQCPRCGFEQPRDRFCAKCGIVMEGFVPQKRPLSERLRSSWAFIVGGCLVLGLVLSYVYRHQPNDHDEDDNPAPTRPYETREAPATEPQAARRTAPLARKAETTVPNSTGAFAPQENFAHSSPVDSRAETSTVLVEFALATRDVMERLSQESDSHLDIGRYSAAIVPQFKTKYDTVRGEQGFVSLASETRNLAMGQPSLVFRGGKEPKTNETIGFYVEVTPVRQTPAATDYKISIKRSLPDIQATGEFKIASQSFEESASVPHNSGMVFAGLLPRKQLVEGEDDLYKNNILRALLEAPFEKGDEEFLILLSLHFNETSN